MVEEEKEEEPKPILILVDERQPPEDGAYSFTMETENGIMQSEVGTPGSAGQTNVKGKYRWVGKWQSYWTDRYAVHFIHVSTSVPNGKRTGDNIQDFSFSPTDTDSMTTL